jgi:hypothetical protein
MNIKKFEDYLIDKIPSVNSKEEVSTDIQSFGEYRKGSDKYGKMFHKLMEYLRYKLLDTNDEYLLINISQFEKESHIKLSEIENFIKDEISKNLYDFEIEILYPKNQIKFKNINQKPKNLTEIKKPNLKL